MQLCGMRWVGVEVVWVKGANELVRRREGGPEIGEERNAERGRRRKTEHDRRETERQTSGDNCGGMMPERDGET